jgi:hypothetical protein
MLLLQSSNKVCRQEACETIAGFKQQCQQEHIFFVILHRYHQQQKRDRQQLEEQILIFSPLLTEARKRPNNIDMWLVD